MLALRAVRRLIVPLVALALALLPGSAAAAAIRCTGDADALLPMSIPVGGQSATGHQVAPVAPPTAAVIMGHGYSFASDGWVPHLRLAAKGSGALAVAMDYRGLVDLGDDPTDVWPYRRSRGYPVKAGSEDLVEAGQAVLRDCPTVRHLVLLGTSMGGNATGMALALNARRPDGSALFDYWIGVEGVYNLLELYQAARAGQAISPFVAQVREDIEKEAGGTPETAPAAYAERTVVARADAVAAAGLKGVVIVHGAQDGLALYEQGLQMARLLRARGVRTDIFTVGSRAPGDDPDTTLGGYAGADTGGAGHGPEVSERHVVIDQGFRSMATLLAGGPVPCDRDFRVEGAPSLSITPDPARSAPGCPAARVLSRPGPPVAACTPGRPTLRGLRAVRIGRLVRVTGRVIRGRCSGGGPRLRVRVIAGRRTSVARTRRGGRFIVTLRPARRTGRVSVRPSDRGRTGRSRTVAVR